MISGVQQWHTKSVLISISDFIYSSEVVTTWKTNSAAYKMKPRSFYKFVSPSQPCGLSPSGMKHIWQHERLSVQKETSEEIGRLIYRFIYYYYSILFSLRSLEKWAKIITIEIKIWNIKTNFIEEVSCPNKLMASIRKGYVLSLS